MISLRTKLFAAATPFAISSVVLAAVSTTVDGGQDAYLIRLSMWLLAFGALVVLVTWDMHRVCKLRQDVKRLRNDLASAVTRADDAENFAEGLARRLAVVEGELQARELAKRVLADDEFDLLRTYLQEDRN